MKSPKHVNHIINETRSELRREALDSFLSNVLRRLEYEVSLLRPERKYILTDYLYGLEYSCLLIEERLKLLEPIKNYGYNFRRGRWPFNDVIVITW